MSLLRLAPYRDIAAEVADRLAGGEIGQVLVPSSGFAKAVADALLQRKLAGAAGLRIETIETFARRVVNDAGELPRIADERERRLAMRMAVRAVDDPMMESRGIAAMLERSLRDVRDSGLTLADFESRVRGARRLRNSARTRVVLRAWREYERLIAQLKAVDPADVLKRAAEMLECGGLPPHSKVVVAGFYDMTGAQRLVVEALRRAGALSAVYVPAGDGDAYRFAAPFVQSLDPTPHPRNPATAQPHVTVTRHDTATTELRSVCADVASLIQAGVDARNIAIVARSLQPYDVALVNRFAAEHGFATSAGEELPLIGQRIGRGVANLLRLHDGGYRRTAVIELLRDGFMPRRRVDVNELDLATRRARIAGGTSEELRPRAKSAAIDAYVDVVAELESLQGRKLGDLVEHFRIETEEDLAAADRIDELAATFDRVARWRRDIDAQTIISTLEHEFLRSPAPGSRSAHVFLGDVMRFRGRSFAHVFLIRMQDDVFPQRRVDDPLLPDHDRRQLGLREIGDGKDEERMLFQLVLDAAPEVHVSFAGNDAMGKALRGSPLLRSSSEFLGVPRVPREHPTEEPRNSEEPRNASLRQLQLLAKSGTRSPFDGYLSDAALRERLVAAATSVSPTQLEDFGECPQKFLLKHVLGVRDLDDPEHELQINARDKGKVDHRILERFYRELDELDPDAVERIDALVDEAFTALETDLPPFNPTMREIERASTRRILREFVTADLAELRESGFRPKHFEWSFGEPRHGRTSEHPQPFTMELANDVILHVSGTIDRIDAGPEGYRIIDYKGGKATRHKDLAKKIDRGVRLQLAVYAMAVARFFGADAASVGGAIRPLVAGEPAAKFTFALADKETALRETLDLFVRSIVDGVFPAFPADNDADFNACKYCPVNHSCRTRHDFAQKYAITRAGEPRTLLRGGAE